MKSTIKFVALSAMALFFASCSDDDNAAQPNTFGDAEVYFDNGVAGDALVLGSNYTNSNGETLNIERLNYIVSNFVLIDENGTQFTYPKENSYFVISEEDNRLTVHLENIPAGNYKKVKFGIGVDDQRYLQGETAQQSFWDLAAQHDLTWTWSTGYKFILFEGTFTTPQATGEKGFMVHQGSNTSTDNYREVTLNLPTTARVRPDALPSIHIKSDVNVLLDGANKISLFANLNPAGTSAGIMGGENLVKIAANSLGMFTVDHVHNGSGSAH
ncbi:MAG: MbnP family protein [Flavobacterium sp.]